MQALFDEQALRQAGITEQVPRMQDESCKIDYYVSQYERSGMADVVIFPYLKDGRQTQFLSDEHIDRLINIGTSMMAYASFQVITIHDEFKCHPNHMNHLRQQYINVFAELAESNILSDILSQIHGCKGAFPKLSNNLAEKIRESNYALS